MVRKSLGIIGIYWLDALYPNLECMCLHVLATLFSDRLWGCDMLGRVTRIFEPWTTGSGVTRQSVIHNPGD